MQEAYITDPPASMGIAIARVLEAALASTVQALVKSLGTTLASALAAGVASLAAGVTASAAGLFWSFASLESVLQLSAAGVTLADVALAAGADWGDSTTSHCHCLTLYFWNSPHWDLPFWLLAHLWFHSGQEELFFSWSQDTHFCFRNCWATLVGKMGWGAAKCPSAVREQVGAEPGRTFRPPGGADQICPDTVLEI